jgi:glycosyltransferase involved in cell wall biosynthesis
MSIQQITKFDHAKVESVRIKSTGSQYSDVVIDLPTDAMEAHLLPTVTVVTVTRNRGYVFPLAINNWNRIEYPYDKLTWLVIDDSDSVEQSPIKILKACKDNRIKFFHMQPNIQLEKPETGIGPLQRTITPNEIGTKRNKGCELAESEIIVMMDDDDFLYKQSVLARVVALIFYKKQAVYSDQLGIYNVRHEASHILEGFYEVPEGSLTFMKNWWEKQKFSDSSQREGLGLVENREITMLKIPWFYNLVVVQHKKNMTGLTRNIRYKRGEVEKRISVGSKCPNLKIEFDKEFWKILHEIKELK